MLGKEASLISSFEANRVSLAEGGQDRREHDTRTIILHTFPSMFASAGFNHSQPYDCIGEIEYDDGTRQVLPGFREGRRDTSLHFFTLPEQVVNRTQAYVTNNYLSENVDSEITTRNNPERNCYLYGAYMGGIDAATYRDAAQTLNKRFERQPVVDYSTLTPGTLLVIAHPQKTYIDYGGIEIDHALVSLDNTMGLQVMGKGGPLGITSYPYILDETRKIMLSNPATIWRDGQLPRPEEFQLHRVLTNNGSRSPLLT